MNLHRLALIVIPIFSVVIGCSGNNGKLINQSPDDSKATQKELMDNLSDYHIWYRFDSTVIVFDPKNDDRKILAGGKRGLWWGTVQDPKAWKEFVKANMTSDGEIIPRGINYSMTGVREIWGPDNQLYGFVIHPQGDGFHARLVDHNTLRLRYDSRHNGGSAP